MDEVKKTLPRPAYQLEADSGGFQLYKIVFNEDYGSFTREKVESPDGWQQVMNYLEIELSKEFA